MKKYLQLVAAFILWLCVLLTGCGNAADKPAAPDSKGSAAAMDISSIPAYTNKPYVVVNNNQPFFAADDFTTKSFEKYSKLDSLGRCGVAFANVGKDTMPKEKRGSIGQVKPSGWQTAKYDFVDGKYLYNRCHLIGYQLTAENANERNLITGTRYLNVQGMLPFENMVADYVKETGNHVLYRVTPIFKGNNLVADGVQMEAKSVEDKGEGICFNVYCYNVQPGVEIDYATGKSRLAENTANTDNKAKAQSYILNTGSHKFHKPECNGAKQISAKNRKEYNGSKNELLKSGYSPCSICNP